MSETDRYRNNAVQVRKKTDGGEELRINNKVIEVTPDPSVPGMLRSRYSYLPAPTLRELGEFIVDAQQSLTEPELPGLKPEKEESS